MRHGDPQPVATDACPGSDPELALVTADLSALAILDRLCECESVCECEDA